MPRYREMKVVLLQDVRGQGKKGQIITVSDGYARNYLMPRNLASEATKDVMNAIQKHDEAMQRHAEEEAARARLLVKDLQDVTVRVSVKSGANGKFYGAVTTKEIADALREQKNLDIDSKKMSIDDPIKSYGTYEVKVKLINNIAGKFFVQVTE